MSIKTYHEMNEVIKDLLSRSDEQFDEYVLTRIIELEQQNKRYREAIEKIKKKISKQLEGVDAEEEMQRVVELSELMTMAVKALEGEECWRSVINMHILRFRVIDGNY